jgi:hypothetical protein
MKYNFLLIELAIEIKIIMLAIMNVKGNGNIQTLEKVKKKGENFLNDSLEIYIKYPSTL